MRKTFSNSHTSKISRFILKKILTQSVYVQHCEARFFMVINQEQIQNLLKGSKIPVQPQILVDICMEQAMPSPDLHSVAKYISQDPGLAGSVLKVVNSDFFERSNDIISIDQAVSLLGIDPIINIVNGLSIKGELADETVVQLTGFWDSTTDVALCAATVAKRIGYSMPEAAYNLGLFHNCGIALLLSKHDNYLSVLEEGYSGEYERVIDAENKSLKTNHAVVGYYIAKSWQLPVTICEVIADHHNAARIFNDPLYAGYDPNKKTLLAVLKMSENIAREHQVLGNNSRDFEWELIQESLLDYVGLSHDDFELMSDHLYEMGIGSTGLKLH